MKQIIFIFLFIGLVTQAQINTYDISFENAVHHEASLKLSVPKIKTGSVLFRMSRTSPGRYALHEFAKNIYGFKATNSKGEELTVERPDPYSWKVSGHDGTIHIEYTLFANRGDGTYSQIDETHAHLNIPASFMYAEGYEHRPVRVNFDLREDLNWKVATQLKKETETTFFAPDLYYFMDSPVEISDFDLKSFDLDGQEIRFVLHHQGSKDEFEQYFDQVKRIVKQEKEVYGELPEFDYGKYTFLACYMPNVSGDGMEHRNSTILTDKESLAEGGMKANIGTVAHEFFHAWNVERIRPDDLEPFDFKEANMTGTLWFAEGFTSYYTGLMLCRAGIITPEEYIKGLNGGFNYVWNSPALEYFNPIEMSYQAPFVDAATSVDPLNRENTFVSYYTYGSMLGLALDLELRQHDLNLDDFMELMWNEFGKAEIAYIIKDLERTLATYAGNEFASEFFEKHIYNSDMPNYKKLFANVGIEIKQDGKKDHIGANFRETERGLEIAGNTFKGSPAYRSGLDAGDLITEVNGTSVTSVKGLKKLIAASNGKLNLKFERFGEEKETEVTLSEDPEYQIRPIEKPAKEALQKRKDWLEAK